MKLIKLNLIKKNRAYFKCEAENGYEVKLKITPESENLELCWHDLCVKDVSIRTKYGTNVIYELEGKIENEKLVMLQHDTYNIHLVKACKNLGGRWDAEAKAWAFPHFVENEVDELDYIYNSQKVVVTLTASDSCSDLCSPISFCGYTIATAWGRDTGAKLADNVSLLKGDARSGGSMKNWTTRLIEGSIVKIEVPILVLEKFIDNEIAHADWSSISTDEKVYL